jgi:hypothetical protein
MATRSTSAIAVSLTTTAIGSAASTRAEGGEPEPNGDPDGGEPERSSTRPAGRWKPVTTSSPARRRLDRARTTPTQMVSSTRPSRCSDGSSTTRTATTTASWTANEDSDDDGEDDEDEDDDEQDDCPDEDSDGDGEDDEDEDDEDD